MQRRSVALSIKAADDQTGTFTGLASVFDNLDAHGDIVRRGAFTKTIAAGQPIPLLWEHKADDPRNYVGDVIEATETAEGLQIRGKFDLETEHGQAAYRNVKGRRVGGLSIGYHVRNQTKTAAGNELTDLDLVEVSVVSRGANPAALIAGVKSAGTRETLREKVARAQLQAKEHPMSFYTPTDLANDLDRALIKASTPNPEQLKAGTDRFTKDRDSQLAAARQIVELARELERELTDEEADKVQKHLDAANAATKALADAERDMSIMAQLDAMAKDAGDGPDYGSGAGSAGAGLRLAFTKGMASKAVAKIRGVENPFGVPSVDVYGQKAVAPSGAAVVAQEFVADPIALGQPAMSLLEILPVKRHGSPQFSYQRQSVRTNNAAVVAEGAVKPTSVYSVERIEDQLDVVAHLSEAIPRYWVADNPSLEEWLTNELMYGLGRAVEALALSTIAGASGIQVNAYATSPLVTLRKSLTKIEVSGYDPAAFVLHPNDWEAVELAVASANAVEHMGIPFDPVARRLYGVPVVISVAATEGTAHTLANDTARLDVDSQGVQIQWSETSNADDWSKNLIRARCEGRFATSVLRPLGVVESTLTSP